MSRYISYVKKCKEVHLKRTNLVSVDLRALRDTESPVIVVVDIVIV